MIDVSLYAVRKQRALSMIAAVAIFCAANVVILLFLGHLDDESLRWKDRDFSNYWIASKLILEGNALELFRGHDTYFSHMQDVFGTDYPWHSWSYPPHFLLLIWPLALAPYGISMVLFLLTTLLIYLHAAFAALRRYPDASALYLLPFVLCNVFSAQNGFMTAAMLLYGLTLRNSRPVIAGVAIGLLTVKPQLGILMPILLLFERRWTVILSAAVTAVFTMLIAVLIFGVETWFGYLRETWPYQVDIMSQGSGVFLDMMLSTFGAVRSLGHDATIATYLHTPIAIAAFVVFCWTLFRLGQPYIDTSLIFGTFLISPYSLVYDLGAMVVLSAVIFRRTRAGVLARVVYAGIALLPLIGPVASSLGFPVAPVVLAAGWFLLIHRGDSLRADIPGRDGMQHA